MTHALRPSKHHSGGRNPDSFNGRRRQFVCKILLFGCWEITFSCTAHPLKYKWVWPHMQHREKSMRSCPFFLSHKCVFSLYKIIPVLISKKYSVSLASTFHRARTTNQSVGMSQRGTGTSLRWAFTHPARCWLRPLTNMLKVQLSFSFSRNLKAGVLAGDSKQRAKCAGNPESVLDKLLKVWSN